MLKSGLNMLASKTRACLQYPQNGKEKARAAQNSHHQIATRRLLVQEPIPKGTRILLEELIKQLIIDPLETHKAMEHILQQLLLETL